MYRMPLSPASATYRLRKLLFIREKVAKERQSGALDTVAACASLQEASGGAIKQRDCRNEMPKSRNRVLMTVSER